jgi:hypothetical protein
MLDFNAGSISATNGLINFASHRDFIPNIFSHGEAFFEADKTRGPVSCAKQTLAAPVRFLKRDGER